MPMQLLSIDDPRDNLEKARRMELVKFAQANGVKVTPEMPAILIRKVLRSQRLTHIRIPNRPLGHPGEGIKDEPLVAPASAAVGEETAVEVDAETDLARQLGLAPAPPAVSTEGGRPGRGLDELSRLRRKAKALGIKVDRTDNMITIRAKLAEHGQNAS